METNGITSNKKITPEVILQKLADRLKDKVDDLEYLFYLEKGFEKWLQCELVLSMSNIAGPVAYQKDGSEIKCPIEGYNERICDLSIEDKIDAKNLRADVSISESPFLFNYIDEKDWKLIESEDLNKLKPIYEKAKFNYIELKQIKWIHGDNGESVVEKMVADMHKLKKSIGKNKKYYNPCSYISIACVSFWEKKKRGEEISKRGAEKTILKIRENATKGCDNQFMWERINNEIYLLMLFVRI